jgi:hypothetical protein
MPKPALVALAFGFSFLFSVAPVSAQNNRSFVSGQGFDTNGCALAAPCRTFQRAHDMTNAHGEIAVLDTAGYGSVIITKSIRIIAPDGIEAGVTVSGSTFTGITINAQPNDDIEIRGLTLSGLGVSGAFGITYNSGAGLTVTNCSVTDFSVGVDYVSANGGVFVVTDSYFANNDTGIQFASPAAATGAIQRSVFKNNQDGIAAISSSGSLIVHSSTLVGNQTNGMFTNLAINVYLSASVVMGNATGLRISGAAVQSYGDNRINNNTTDIMGTMTGLATR